MAENKILRRPAKNLRRPAVGNHCPKVFFSIAVNVQSDSLCAWNVQETNATLIFVDRLSSCEATKSNNLPQVTCTNNEYQNVDNSTLLIEKKVTSSTLNVCVRRYNPDFVVCSSTNISGKCETLYILKVMEASTAKI